MQRKSMVVPMRLPCLAANSLRTYTNGNGSDDKYVDYRTSEGGQGGGGNFGPGGVVNFPRFKHKGSAVYPRGLNFESADR